MSIVDSLNDEEFVPLTQMPTARLQDILDDLNSKNLTVLNLESCLLGNYMDIKIIKTIFYSITPSVKTLSLRFNSFKSMELCELLIEWITENFTIEVLYLMGSNMDEKNKTKLDDAWKKNLVKHTRECYGFTYSRVNPDSLFILPPIES